MNILEALHQLRDDIKTWVTNNINALNSKIDEKTIPIDNELDSNSINPVQNKVIANAINNIPRFSGDYNDLTNAPNIAEDDSGNMVISDESGNVIFKVDADGTHSTSMSLNGYPVATQLYVDNAIDAIGTQKIELSDYYTKSEIDTVIESTKQDLSESIVAESEEWKVVDEAGNIIFRVDSGGAHTTAITLNGRNVEDIIDTRVASLVDSAPETLNTLDELAAALGDDANFATTVTNQIASKLDTSELPTVINTALAQAKASGEFDGADGVDGYTPVRGTDYWTDADKAEIKAYVEEAILGGAW